MEPCEGAVSGGTREDLAAALKSMNDQEKSTHEAMIAVAKLAFDWGDSLQW